jgi:hypothetical protein
LCCDRFVSGVCSDQMTGELIERRAQIMQYL